WLRGRRARPCAPASSEGRTAPTRGRGTRRAIATSVPSSGPPRAPSRSVDQARRRYPGPLRSTRPETRSISESLRAVPPGGAPPARLGLALQDEPLDGDDPDGVAGADRCGPVRAGPPPGALDDDHAVGSHVDLGPALLADHSFAPDRRCREARPDHGRHRAE